MAETTIALKPRADWPARTRVRWYSRWAPRWLRAPLGAIWPERTRSSTAELIERLDRAVQLPGWSNAWTAPARARLDMMATGVRTPLAVRIVAARPERLEALGQSVRARLADLPGLRSATFESIGGEPRLTFRAAASGPPVALDRVQATADLVLAGGQVGDVVVDGRRLRVRVLPSETSRGPAEQLREVTVRPRHPELGPVALGLAGQIAYATRPAQLRTERGELVAYVDVDLLGGADLRRFVAEARARLDASVRLEPGERLEWAGQYELLAAGERRLRWILPLVALSMLGLLLALFRSWTEALIVLVSVPFALVGSVWALFLTGYPLSAPVWIGLLSVLGLAMQTGVVMVVYIDEAFYRRVRAGTLTSRDDIIAAHAEGTVRRLRPKLMTMATMAAGLLPLCWADGPGSEILRRVAVPMLGGVVTSGLLTLEVLPVLYTLWRQRQLARALRAGMPIAEVVGPAPSWARAEAEAPAPPPGEAAPVARAVGATSSR
jgi:Cu(I)/Ag(I) efflux system membrane protein CusA/SilA